MINACVAAVRQTSRWDTALPLMLKRKRQYPVRGKGLCRNFLFIFLLLRCQLKKIKTEKGRDATVTFQVFHWRHYFHDNQCFRHLSVFSWDKCIVYLNIEYIQVHWILQKSALNIASSDSQIDKPQHGRPKIAKLPDVDINAGAQYILREPF